MNGFDIECVQRIPNDNEQSVNDDQEGKNKKEKQLT